MANIYREWATARAPILRAELEALPDSVLVAEIEYCNQNPEWFYVTSPLYEELEKHDELQRFLQYHPSVAQLYEEWEKHEELERFRQYHRRIAQKGGRSHRPTRRPPEILEACKDMYARYPKVAAQKAHKKLSGKGHKMPDGRVIRFTRPIAFETFRTKIWPQRRTAYSRQRHVATN
jgi:hypothetical protein